MFSTKEGRVESIETVPDTENDPIKQPYYITNSHTAMNENKVQELQDVVMKERIALCMMGTAGI